MNVVVHNTHKILGGWARMADRQVCAVLVEHFVPVDPPCATSILFCTTTCTGRWVSKDGKMADRQVCAVLHIVHLWISFLNLSYFCNMGWNWCSYDDTKRELFFELVSICVPEKLSIKGQISQKFSAQKSIFSILSGKLPCYITTSPWRSPLSLN